MVKGGGQGFGRAYCLGLAVEGATVAIAEMAEESALETQVAVLELRGHAVVYHTDVRDEASVLAMRDAVERDLGGIDGLINNTGILSRIPMAETTGRQEVWDGVFDTNVWGGARAVVPSMSRRRGGASWRWEKFHVFAPSAQPYPVHGHQRGGSSAQVAGGAHRSAFESRTARWPPTWRPTTSG